MIKTVLTVLCLLFAFVAFSQTANQRKSINFNVDSLKCQQLYQLIEAEWDENIWIKYNQELFLLSSKNSINTALTYKQRNVFLKFLSDAKVNEGAYYQYKSKHQKAIDNYSISYLIAKKINYYEGCAIALGNIGTSFDYLGKIDSSLNYFIKALNYAYKSKSNATTAYVLTDLGYVYNNLGNYKKAIVYNLKALSLFTKLKDYEGLERTYFAIGKIFDNQKEFDKSIFYYKKALFISTKTNNQERLCINLNSLANVYIILKKYPEAKKNLEKSFLITKKNNFLVTTADCFSLFGDYYFTNNDYKNSELNYLKAIKIFKNTQTNFFYAKSLTQLAKIYFINNQLNLAQYYAQKSYTITIKNNYPGEIKSSSEILIKIYTQKKQYKNALAFTQIVQKINDSIYYNEKQNIALKLEHWYTSKFKENQINKLTLAKKIADLENQRQQNILFFLFVLLLFFGVLSYFIFNRYKTKKQNQYLKLQLLEVDKRIFAEKQAAESELKALKSQMNPHFIFNALSSIQHQFMYGDKNLANEQMGNFTYLTRQILNVSGLKQILITTEIEILTKYLELEKMRFETNFEYEITLSGNLDPDYHELPPMLLQPLLENSIKHGLMHLQGLKKLSLNFNLNPTEDVLICTIIDNGIGRQKSEELNLKNLSNHQSYASQALVQRLNIWNKNIDNPLVYSDILDNNGVVFGTQVVLMVEVH